MRNVPNVSDWGKKVDLEQGSFEHATLVDPAAKVQFYNDFGIEGATKKKPPSLFELPETPAESYQRRVIFTQVISPQTAYLITSMMHTVASSGTGARSNVLKKIVAGKTGTTNDYVDAWFIGFSPDLLAGVWVGNDKGSRPLGKSESGSKAALPIWIDFMKEALKNQPVKDFKVPKGITVTKIDPQNGLLAHPDTPKAYREYFKTGTQPVEYTPKIDDVNEMDFFEIDLE
jgi:membrane carboxypeptidase/penicillin-binding protein